MTSPADIPPVLRPAVKTDMAMVHSSWLKSFRLLGGKHVSEMRKHDYFTLQNRRIDMLLGAGCPVMILHPEGTPNVIAAWACLDVAPEVFHYVYTVAHHRKKGYAKKLVGDRTVCTHMTDSRRPDSFAAWKQRAGFRYVPHLLDAA